MLFVAVALFLTALPQAPARHVESAYQEWLQAQASGDVQRICEQESLSVDGSAALRARYLDDCVEDWRGEITGERIVFWQRAAQLKVVTIRVDDDYASASLRSGTCTLQAWDAGFERLEDGRWVYEQAYDPWQGDRSTCRERQGIPVPGDPGVVWPPVR
ncbi:hypothetical protein OJ998_10155 [Solirubrobacter taibaiensis]|nr:hypothetical protein [Solirubrobacter taibaiensis]